jgi:hypothetical protein
MLYHIHLESLLLLLLLLLLLQVIKLLHGAFQAAGLGLYLRAYGCLPTGYECGIIEVCCCFDVINRCPARCGVRRAVSAIPAEYAGCVAVAACSTGYTCGVLADCCCARLLCKLLHGVRKHARKAVYACCVFVCLLTGYECSDVKVRC